MTSSAFKALVRTQETEWVGRHGAGYFPVDGAYAERMAEIYERASDKAAIMPVGDYIALRDDMRVLELGCGFGAFGCQIARHVKEYIGVDIAWNIVEHGNKAIEQVGIRNMTLLAIPDCNPLGALAGQEGFDLIFSTAVLIHTPPEITRRYLRQTAQLLLPEGRFWNQINIVRHPVKETHQGLAHTYSETSYAEMHADAGLVVERAVEAPDFLPGQFARYAAGRLAQNA